LTTGTITYTPIQYGVGQNYSQFVFTLTVVDPAHPNNPVLPLTVTYTINVIPVVQKPVLHPGWNAALGELLIFDEDYYGFSNFSGTNIGTPIDQVFASSLLLLSPFQVVMYTCAGATSVNCSTPAWNKANGNGNITRIYPGFWKVSFVAYHNWNGDFKQEFILGNGVVNSLPVSLHGRVLPIDDPPNLVISATTVSVEYYTCTKSAVCSLAQSGQEGVAFDIYEDPPTTIDGAAAASITKRDSTLVYSQSGSSAANPPACDSTQSTCDHVIRVDRLRTEVQDVDFRFGYKLMYNMSLIRATLALHLIDFTHAPCYPTGNYQLNCWAEITHLNAYLSGPGIPLMIDNGQNEAGLASKRDSTTTSTSGGIAVILLNDTGNIDKWNRWLTTGYVIEWFLPLPPVVSTAPIAAVVILPVIAAVTAAAIAAAWILLGQRAQDYAGASFDAFSASTQGGGNASPLYDSKGLECDSPLYNGQNSKG